MSLVAGILYKILNTQIIVFLLSFVADDAFIYSTKIYGVDFNKMRDKDCNKTVAALRQRLRCYLFLEKKGSLRVISTTRLHTLLHFHL